MSDAPIIVGEAEGGADNQVMPFRLEGADIRGRAVRLGTVADQILSAHDYPPTVGALLGELLALTALLGSMFKFDGTLTVQAKGKSENGTKNASAISLLVADFETGGGIRGYAQFDAEKVEDAGEDATPDELLGVGHLVMTIDPADPDLERHQGIVELAGGSLSDCARAYFRSSEQIATEVYLAASADPLLEPLKGNWRAGGIMVQHLGRAEAGSDRFSVSSEDGDDKDSWQRTAALLETVKHEELLDPQLELSDLLYRLFHEDGVRAFDAIKLSRGCRCSEEKISGVLESFSSADRDDMVEDGRITVTCEFCNRDFIFGVDAGEDGAGKEDAREADL